MTIRTQTSRAKHHRSAMFSLFIGLGLLFAASHLFANDPPPAQQAQAESFEPSESPTQELEPNDLTTTEQTTTDYDRESGELQNEIHHLEVQSAVDSFSEFVTSFQRDQAYETYINTYSIRGLRTMTDTLGAIIRQEDQRLMQEQQNLYREIVRIETMPRAQRDTQSSLVKEAFLDAATLLINVQRQYYPDYDQQTQKIASLAVALRPETQLHDQADELNDFFLAASLTMEHMARSPLNPIGGGPLTNPGQQNDDHFDENPAENLDEGYDFPFDENDPLEPTQPISPSEPLDPTDPMEIKPLAPAPPFDASNPQKTAPLDD